MNNKEAVLFGFQVKFNDRGVMVLETTGLPDEYYEEVFPQTGDRNDIKLLKREFDRRFKSFMADAEKIIMRC